MTKLDGITSNIGDLYEKVEALSEAAVFLLRDRELQMKWHFTFGTDQAQDKVRSFRSI